MDKELFELCKEVYEKTGWGEEGEPDIGVYNYQHDKRRKPEYLETSYRELDHDKDHGDFFNGGYPTWIAPLYTSDYLLEKLLPIARIIRFAKTSNGDIHLLYEPKTPDYEAYISNTPLKVLLKLTLTLYKRGELV